MITPLDGKYRVKTSCNVPEAGQGIDAAKKIKGRKRHIVTDTLGLLVAVLVTAASVHDSVGGKNLLDQVGAAQPTVTKMWVDGGYSNTTIGHGARLGINVHVMKKRATPTGFTPLPKRWVIEQTFGRLMQHRRLVRDYETLPRRSRAMVHWATANKMARALTGESTLS